MLFLTRKQGQEIIINNDFRIVVVNLYPGYVRLGFDFPETYKVWRKEVFDRMEMEKEENDLVLEEIENDR